MRPEYLHELFEKNLIAETQHTNLESILRKKVFSVFYELRVILYLGVLLFTTGVGFLIYKNIGELGHMLAIITLSIIAVLSFWYAFHKAVPYSNEKTEVPIPYYDYVLLMGCLLLVSVLGYIQFQYQLFDENLEITTLLTAFIFFVAAYRFDHLGVLSLGITAWASFWGLSTSPQKWYSGDFIDDSNLHIVALIFGAAMIGVAMSLEKKSIKKHFTFTYVHVNILIYLVGTLAGMIMNEHSYFGFLLLLYVGCGFAVYYANTSKSFLFLIYAFVFGYIGTTFLLTDFVLDDTLVWSVYLIASCGGFIYFIVRYRNYFKRS